MPTASHCVFCDLIRRSAEVSMCYEDATALAFMDIQPVNPYHVLVVPREHYESLEELPRDVARHLFEVTATLSAVVQKVSGTSAMNIVVNSGAAAGQDVFHFHVHLIPRRANDGFDVPLPFAGSPMPDRTHLDATAARIIAALRDPVRDPTPRSVGAVQR